MKPEGSGVNHQFCPARWVVFGFPPLVLCHPVLVQVGAMATAGHPVLVHWVSPALGTPNYPQSTLAPAPAAPIPGSLRHSLCLCLWTLWTPLVVLRPLLLPCNTADAQEIGGVGGVGAAGGSS